MALTVTKKSGSVGIPDIDVDVEIPVDDGNDLLKECTGGCGKKILFFGFPDDESEWGDGVEGAYCIDCRSKPLKHTPKEK